MGTLTSITVQFWNILIKICLNIQWILILIFSAMESIYLAGTLANLVDIWFFSVWFFFISWSFVKIIANLFSHYPISYWVVSDMKDTFSFFFLWLEVWLYHFPIISCFYNQKAILKILLDLNGFENPYQYMLCDVQMKIKMN